jgi:molybdenum cofactor cytidylyltransferase
MIGRASALNIVILAAGFSVRLAEPKPLARVHQRSLLNRTLAAVAPLKPARIFIVVPPHFARHRLEARGRSVIFLPNRDRHQGLATSVRLGVHVARFATALLILPVDLPYLQSAELRRLKNAWLASPQRVLARRIEAGGGAPLILPQRFFGAARHLQGDAGLRAFVERLAPEERRFIDMATAREDLDTRGQLAVARSRFTPSSPVRKVFEDL